MAEETPIEEYLMTSDSKSLKVLLWLLKKRDKDNRIFTTLDSAALDCKVTKVTINKVFQKLYDTGFMVKVRNGEYQLKKV